MPGSPFISAPQNERFQLLSDFASFVDRLVGGRHKAPGSARHGEAVARWLNGADAVFGAVTEFLLSLLIFLTVAGAVVAIGR